jgi:hypothetical protein
MFIINDALDSSHSYVLNYICPEKADKGTLEIVFFDVCKYLPNKIEKIVFYFEKGSDL